MTAKDTNLLRQQLKKLDQLRTRIAALQERESELAAAAIAAMQRHKLDRFNFAANRQAALVAKSKKAVDPQAFREQAIQANLGDDAIDACLKESVLIGPARKHLGQERFDAIATTTPGKPELRITGQRTA